MSSDTESMLIARLRDMMIDLPEDVVIRTMYGNKGRAPRPGWQWWIVSEADPDFTLGSQYTRTECTYYRDAEVRTSNRHGSTVHEVAIPSLESRSD